MELLTPFLNVRETAFINSFKIIFFNNYYPIFLVELSFVNLSGKKSTNFFIGRLLSSKNNCIQI